MKQRCAQCTAPFDADDGSTVLCPACRVPFGDAPAPEPPPPMAGAWRRWAARTIDLTVSLFFVLLILPFVWVALIAVFSSAPPTTPEETKTVASAVGILSIFIFFLLGLPIILLGETLLYAIFRSTPGKSLFGIAVVDAAGRKLTRRAYLVRNLYLYLCGFGLGIMFIRQGLMIYQGLRVASGRPTSYDAATGSTAALCSNSLLKTAFGIVLLVFCLLLPLVGSLACLIG